ncbi:MAG: hypothetical protein IKU90_02070 [Clostridia bacterium]|nr:hypothetical protein [Clostridia bacterium]
MKKKIRIVPLLLAGLMLAACTSGVTPEQTTAETVTEAPAETTAFPETEPATEATTDTPAEETTALPETEPVTEEETEAPAPERMVTDMYGDGYNVNMLVGFDEYGRSLTPVSSRKEDKEVGIFYFLWLGQHGMPDIYDNSIILEQYGKETLFYTDDRKVSPAGQFHWWSEPLYGYYNSSDEWVIRRHMEMLTQAGVDFLVFDVSNCFTYQGVATKVMKVISELRAEGWDAPQITYLTHSRSIQTIKTLYNDVYKAELYPESWYRVDGKPMMIGYTDEADDLNEAASRGDTSYKPGDLPQELQDFFYMREVLWPYESGNGVENAWPYTEWRYPQPVRTDMISVSIATHPALPFSFSLTHEGRMNWGRGYDPRRKTNSAEAAMSGLFFDYQWQTVLKKDPRFVMITGWNEWVAQKNMYEGEYSFVDGVDLEYSRDAEPMKGGYEDAYYIQMMYYIRQYKYNSAEGMIADTVRKTVDVAGTPDQWNDVNAVYRRVGNDDGSRNSVGGAPTVRYEQEAVRNNITEVRVTNDTENLYFYIKCESDIVASDDGNWMNLFIGTGTSPAMKGWESYEFAVNRSRNGGSASIEALNADYTGTALDATATYTVQGNVMQIKVPRAALGLEKGGDFYFKVADGVVDSAEIMDYYVTGRSFPMGRLSYLYQMDK